MLKLISNLLVIIIICPLTLSSQIIVDTEKEIQISLDYARSGLVEDGKKNLISLLHDELDNNLNSKIRYTLGTICFYENDTDCLSYHWGIVLRDSPNSPEAVAIKEINNTFDFFLHVSQQKWHDDFNFANELETSRRFWTYIQPDYKMKWESIKDPYIALEYLKNLSIKYENDSQKRAMLLFDKFRIYSGQCDDWSKLFSPEYKSARYMDKNEDKE